MMNKTVTAFSKLNYYYEEGRTLFRSPGWCLFKLYDIIVLPLSVDQSKKMEANAFIKMAQYYNNLIIYGQPMRSCSSALNLSVVCILTRNCTEGCGVCLDRMRDCVDQSKKMEANAFIKMAQYYNNLIMKRSKK
jgi:uncharacterized protein YbjQ (UPF0145 family)